jgi:hypothetical protein
MAGATLGGFMGAGAVPLISVGVMAVFWWCSKVYISPAERKKAAANSAIHGISRRTGRGWATSRYSSSSAAADDATVGALASPDWSWPPPLPPVSRVPPAEVSLI